MLLGHLNTHPATLLQQTVVKKRHPNPSPNLTPIPTRLCPQKVPPGGGEGGLHSSGNTRALLIQPESAARNPGANPKGIYH
jgi:hypothetical protein